MGSWYQLNPPPVTHQQASQSARRITESIYGTEAKMAAAAKAPMSYGPPKSHVLDELVMGVSLRARRLAYPSSPWNRTESKSGNALLAGVNIGTCKRT